MKKTIVIHPYLFAIFPIISFYNHNKDIAKFSHVLYPLIISILFTITLLSVVEKFVKNKLKTAFISSIFIISFFSFGHFIDIIPCFYITIKELTITTDFLLFVIWIDIIVLATILILKSKKSLIALNSSLNFIAIILFFLPLLNLGIYEYKSKKMLESIRSKNHNFIVNSNKKLPDIYYIIFDAYAREDVLKEFYQYDNRDFINYLTAKGFFVAHQSRANYPQTGLSIASSLNFEYINYISEITGEESSDRNPLNKLIINNNAYKLLKSNGYLFVTVPASFSELDFYSDIHMHSKKMELNDFQITFLNTTPLNIIWGKYRFYNSQRRKIINSFNYIPDIAKIDSPTFVYAHFPSPHPPFIFNKDGKPINPRGKVTNKDGSHYLEYYPNKEEYREKYKNQIEFINTKAKEMINKILNRSNRPPIIILQSDHGPGSMTDWEDPGKTNMMERLSILNAYYLPEEGKKLLYESITPVNTFRVIFNYLFNTNLEILKDQSYFATWDHPYKFINVSETLRTD